MIEQQAEFPKLAVIDLEPYPSIAKTFNVTPSELTKWDKEFKTERDILAQLRNTWKRKFKEVDFWHFKQWMETTPKQCYYFKITEEQINTLWQKYPDLTKRTRRRKLEIVSKKPNE